MQRRRYYLVFIAGFRENVNAILLSQGKAVGGSKHAAYVMELENATKRNHTDTLFMLTVRGKIVAIK